MSQEEQKAKDTQRRNMKYLVQLVKLLCDHLEDTRDKNDFAHILQYGNQNEQIMARMERAPGNFGIYKLERGDQESFEKMLKDNDIPFMKTHSVDVSDSPQYIIAFDDWERFKETPAYWLNIGELDSDVQPTIDDDLFNDFNEEQIEGPTDKVSSLPDKGLEEADNIEEGFDFYDEEISEDEQADNSAEIDPESINGENNENPSEDKDSLDLDDSIEDEAPELEEDAFGDEEPSKDENSLDSEDAIEDEAPELEDALFDEDEDLSKDEDSLDSEDIIKDEALELEEDPFNDEEPSENEDSLNLDDSIEDETPELEEDPFNDEEPSENEDSLDSDNTIEDETLEPEDTLFDEDEDLSENEDSLDLEDSIEDEAPDLEDALFDEEPSENEDSLDSEDIIEDEAPELEEDPFGDEELPEDENSLDLDDSIEDEIPEPEETLFDEESSEDKDDLDSADTIEDEAPEFEENLFNDEAPSENENSLDSDNTIEDERDDDNFGYAESNTDSNNEENTFEEDINNQPDNTHDSIQEDSYNNTVYEPQAVEPEPVNETPPNIYESPSQDIFNNNVGEGQENNNTFTDNYSSNIQNQSPTVEDVNLEEPKVNSFTQEDTKVEEPKFSEPVFAESKTSEIGSNNFDFDQPISNSPVSEVSGSAFANHTDNSSTPDNRSSFNNGPLNNEPQLQNQTLEQNHVVQSPVVEHASDNELKPAYTPPTPPDNNPAQNAQNNVHIGQPPANINGAVQPVDNNFEPFSVDVSHTTFAEGTTGKRQDLAQYTIAKNAAGDRDQQSYAKQGFYAVREDAEIFHQIGTRFQSMESAESQYNRLMKNFSPEAKDMFKEMWNADTNAQKRLLEAAGGDSHRAQLLYISEIAKENHYLEKRGVGVFKAQSVVSATDKTNMDKNIFGNRADQNFWGKEKRTDTITIGHGSTKTTVKINEIYDTRTAKQLQDEGVFSKISSLKGEKWTNSRKDKILSFSEEMRNNSGRIGTVIDREAQKDRHLGAYTVWNVVKDRAMQAARDNVAMQAQMQHKQFVQKTDKVIRIGLNVRKTALLNKKKNLLKKKAKVNARQNALYKKYTGKYNKALSKGNTKKAARIRKRYGREVTSGMNRLEKINNGLSTEALGRNRLKADKIDKILQFDPKKEINKRIKKAGKAIKKRTVDKMAKGTKTLIKKQLKKTKVGRKLLKKHVAKKLWLKKLITKFRAGKLANIIGGVMDLQAILQKLLMKLVMFLLKIAMKFLAGVFLFALVFMIVFCITIMPLMLIFELTENEDAEAFDGAVEETTLGLVYFNLVDRETEWANSLITDMDDEVPFFDELTYSVFSGDKIINYSPQEYAEQILKTTYLEDEEPDYNWFDGHSDDSWDAIKGKEPFPGAPDEAYKRIFKIDGGKELQFIGAGGNKNLTSNAKEITAMAQTVQFESSDVFEDSPEDTKSIFKEGTFWADIDQGFRKVKETIISAWDFVKHAVSNFLKSLAYKMDQATGSEFWENIVANYNARVYMGYASPLFEHSHSAEKFGLKLEFLPTTQTSGSVFAPTADANAVTSKIKLTCPGDEDGNDHEGHGCMSYSGFTMPNPDGVLYYNGSPVYNAYPAAFIESDDEYGKLPVAPTGDGATFAKRYGDSDHKDWWTKSVTSTKTIISSSDPTKKEIENSDAFDVGTVISVKSKDGGYTFEVKAVSDVTKEEKTITPTNGKKSYTVNEYTYTVTTYTYTYNGANATGIKGYYCGSHLILVNYATVYGFTESERKEDEANYGAKNHTVENDGETDLPDYIVLDAPTITGIVGELVAEATESAYNSELLNKDLCKDAEDLFEIDAVLAHTEGSVHKDFPGWSLGSITNAVNQAGLEWDSTYGITTSETIAGIDTSLVPPSQDPSNTPGGATVGTKMTQEQIDAIIAELESDPAVTSDPAWPQRKQALLTAFSYVGQLHYSQNHHGDKLSVGGTTDCSGFCSRVWNLSTVYSTLGFLGFGDSTGTRSRFSTATAKPGDVLILTKSDGSRHAVLYVGVINGQTMSVDIGSEETGCRYMHKDYYERCDVIDMGSALGLS